VNACTAAMDDRTANTLIFVGVLPVLRPRISNRHVVLSEVANYCVDDAVLLAAEKALPQLSAARKQRSA